MRLNLLPVFLLPLGAVAIPNPALDAAAALASIAAGDTLEPRANGKSCGGQKGGGGGGWTGQGWTGGGEGAPAGIPSGGVPSQPEILKTTVRPIGQKTVTPDPVARPSDPAPIAAPSPSPAPAPAPEPEPEPQPEPPAAPASDGQGMDQAAWIAPHTAARAKYGQGPVGWSTGAEAQAQANVAAHRDSCNLEHTNGGKYGENLMAGSGGNGVASAADTVGAWMSEGVDFDYSNPDGNHSDLSSCVCLWDQADSTGGKVVGHFTAIVWKTVKNVGCAVGTCGVSACHGMR